MFARMSFILIWIANMLPDLDKLTNKHKQYSAPLCFQATLNVAHGFVRAQKHTLASEHAFTRELKLFLLHRNLMQ